MIRENQKLLNQLNMLTDGAATFAAMLLSYWLRFDVLSAIAHYRLATTYGWEQARRY